MSKKSPGDKVAWILITWLLTFFDAWVVMICLGTAGYPQFGYWKVFFLLIALAMVISRGVRSGIGDSRLDDEYR